MNIGKNVLGIAALALAGTALSGMSAHAAGFYIQEQSVSGLGAAFAGQAAMARDSSILYYNPAGITQLPGTQVNAGAHLLAGSAELTDTGTTGLGAGAPDGENPFDPAVVPNLYLTHELTDRVWLGIGMASPFGLGNEYGADQFNRFDALKSHLTTVEIYPTLAVKLTDRISIGASLIYQYVDAELTNSLTVGTEGEQKLEAQGTTFGYNLGIYAEPIDGTTVGIDYRSRTNTDLSGRLTIEGTAIDTSVPGTSGLHLPDIATFSVAQEINPQWTVLASATWFGWNTFEDIQVFAPALGGFQPPVTQNYQTTWAYAIGAEYEYNDTWTFRAGYQFDETPTVDEFRTSRTPDGDRHWFTAGTTYTLNDQWSFDFSAGYIDIGEEQINVTRNLGASNVQADTDGYVGLLAAGVNYKF